MTGLEGAFEIVKPFLEGIIKFWWIFAIVIIVDIIIKSKKK